TMYMGSQSLLFYSLAAWVPSLLIDHGMSETRAGFMLSLSPLFGTAGSLVAPLLVDRRSDQRWLIWPSTALGVFGIAGLLIAPATATMVWVMTFGFGNGMMLSLALTFMGLRAPDAQHAAALSGMSQSVGYTLAALGPLLIGVLHD